MAAVFLDHSGSGTDDHATTLIFDRVGGCDCLLAISRAWNLSAGVLSTKETERASKQARERETQGDAMHSVRLHSFCNELNAYGSPHASGFWWRRYARQLTTVRAGDACPHSYPLRYCITLHAGPGRANAAIVLGSLMKYICHLIAVYIGVIACTQATKPLVGLTHGSGG